MPAILQQAQIQQLGRVHTVNIVLRNVPNNNNNNNNQNGTNAANPGAGENTAAGVGDNANARATGTRNDGVQRPNIPPMVNLVFRNMTGGLANNRNGNASLSFVFRNVRNIMQNLQQNTATSTSTSGSTTTTATTSIPSSSPNNVSTTTSSSTYSSGPSHDGVSSTTTATSTVLGTQSASVNPVSSATGATPLSPQLPETTQYDSTSSFSSSSFTSSLLTSSPFTSSIRVTPVTSSIEVTPISSSRQLNITTSSETIDNNASDSTSSKRTCSTSVTPDLVSSCKNSFPFETSPDSSQETSSGKDKQCNSNTSPDDTVHKDGIRYKAIPVAADERESNNHPCCEGLQEFSSDCGMTDDTGSVLGDTSGIRKSVGASGILIKADKMTCSSTTTVDHPITRNSELTNDDCQAVEGGNSSDVIVEHLQSGPDVRHCITSDRHCHHRPHLDSESSG